MKITKIIKLILISLIIFGCGTITVLSETEVINKSEFSHSIELTFDGLLAEAIKEESEEVSEFEEIFNQENLSSLGFQYEEIEFPDSITFKISGEIGQIESRWLDLVKTSTEYGIPLIIDEEKGPDGYTYTTIELKNEGIFDDLEIEDPEPSDDEWEQAGEALGAAFINDMFKVEWELKFPGELVSTNADNLSRNTAYWKRGFYGVEDFILISRTKTPSMGSCEPNIEDNIQEKSNDEIFNEIVELRPTSN